MLRVMLAGRHPTTGFLTRLRISGLLLRLPLLVRLGTLRRAAFLMRVAALLPALVNHFNSPVEAGSWRGNVGARPGCGMVAPLALVRGTDSASRAISPPIASDAVAAGLGAFSTCTASSRTTS